MNEGEKEPSLISKREALAVLGGAAVLGLLTRFGLNGEDVTESIKNRLQNDDEFLKGHFKPEEFNIISEMASQSTIARMLKRNIGITIDIANRTINIDLSKYILIQREGVRRASGVGVGRMPFPYHPVVSIDTSILLNFYESKLNPKEVAINLRKKQSIDSMQQGLILEYAEKDDASR